MPLTKEQLEERVTYIGSSDAPGVLGLSRWKTPLMVWAEKTGQIKPADISGELRIQLGHKLEPVIAELFEEKTGKKVRRVNETLFHPVHKFIASNIDRRIVGENAIAEFKTVAAWKKKEWAGEEIPQEYIIQCWHQLAVTGLQKVYLVALIGNEDFIIKEIPRDENILEDLIKREVAFWNDFVVPKVMPTTITKHDADTLYSLFPEAEEGSVIDLADEANRVIENLVANRADLLNLEGLIKQSENELKAMLKDKERGRTSMYEIAWVLRKTTRMDLQAFKKDQLENYLRYCKPIQTRVFKYQEIKETVNVESD